MVPPFVKRYLIALDRHKWAGLAGFIVVTGLSGVAAVLQSPPANVYVATGLLTYSTPPETFSTTGAALQQQGQAVTKEMLLSSNVLRMTVEHLAAQRITISPDRLLERARVSTGDKSSEESATSKTPAPILKITVAYQDADQDKAKAIATALMDAMVEQSRQFNTQQLNRIIANLNQLLPKVTRELQQAEQNLEAFVRREGTAIQTAESGNLLNALVGNQQQQREARLSLAGINTQIGSLESRLGLTPAQAYASSALSADPIIADLRAKIYQAEAQQELLSKTLRPDHPSMIDLKNQLDSYNQLLQERVTEVVGGTQGATSLIGGSQIRQASSLDPARQALASTLVNLQTQQEMIQQQIANLMRTEQDLRQQYASIPNKQLEQQRLQQQVTLKQTFYNQIQTRLADVKLAQEETVGSLVVVQPPVTEQTVTPSVSGIVILLVGGVVGLLVGGGLILLLGSIDATFYTLEDLQAALRQQEVPVLGLLPSLHWSDEIDGLPVIAQAASPYIEPYERLRSNLRRAGGGKALKVVLLTSTVGAEGKSTSAYNLAIASARAGKRTLLIEADLRSPSQAQSLNVAPDSDSIIEPLRYYGSLSDCIRLVPDIENLYIVPSAGPQRQAAAILESSEMRRLLDDGRGRFDLVVLDAPSLSRYNDALLLEPHTDGIVLITRPGYTEEGVLNEAVEQFIASEDIQFLGAVINDADIPIEPHEPQPEDPIEVEIVDRSEDLEQPEKLEKLGIGSRDVL
jgi:capsular exopolysaccharide synthesis family protein